MWWTCCHCAAPSTIELEFSPTGAWWAWYYPDFSFIDRNPTRTDNNIWLGVTRDSAHIRYGGLWAFVVNIAQGSTIDSAELFIPQQASTGTLCDSPGSEPRAYGDIGVPCFYSKQLKLDWTAEDEDDATEYTTVAGVNGATRTSSTLTTYDTASSYGGGDAFAYDGDEVVLADMTSQVQSIINRAGWSSGNYMQFFVEDNGSDAGFDSGSGVDWGTEMTTSYDVNFNAEVNLRVVVQT